MPGWLWFASFVYLAALAAFIFTAMKDDEAEGRALSHAVSFFALIAGGTVVFCLVVLLVQAVF